MDQCDREGDTSYKCAPTQLSEIELSWFHPSLTLWSLNTLRVATATSGAQTGAVLHLVWSQLTPHAHNSHCIIKIDVSSLVTSRAPPLPRPWVWTWACWRGGSLRGSGARCSCLTWSEYQTINCYQHRWNSSYPYPSRDRSRHSRGWGTSAPGTARGLTARTWKIKHENRSLDG